MRLIDADALDFALVDEYMTEGSKTNVLSKNGRAIFNAAIDVARCRAGDVDTVDAEPLRRGRWDDKSIAFCNVCSECHTAVDRTACFPRISRKGIVQPIVGKLNYCPNCGAKMDGGAEDEG